MSSNDDMSQVMSDQDFRISVVNAPGSEVSGNSFRGHSIMPSRVKSPFDTKNHDESIDEDIDA